MSGSIGNPDGARKATGLGLLSGGLDSTLAARLLQEQGIEVRAVHFSTGFCMVDHRRAIGRPADRDQPNRIRNQALRAAGDLEIPVKIIDVADEFLREVVLNPKHGYGSGMNPCIDCRIFMLRKAKQIALDTDADFIFTGEVLGQRPMSQLRASLDLIEQEAEVTGFLLRPLCARYMPPTDAEKKGLVDRERLGQAHGRSRKEQIRMADELGVTGYPPPAGGCCFLVDKAFTRRFRDLLAHIDPDHIDSRRMVLLKLGRHFRLGHDVKAVFGRDRAESTFLKSYAGDSLWICQVSDGRGSLGVVEGEPDDKRSAQLGSLAARYSRHRDSDEVEVLLYRRGEHRLLRLSPASGELVSNWLI